MAVAIAARICLTALLAFAAGNAAAQTSPDGLWQLTGAVEFPPRTPLPTGFTGATLDVDALRTALAGAPRETPGPFVSDVSISLPLPDGRFGEVAVAVSPIMEAPLQLAFPEIQTYVLRSIPDGSITGRLAVGPLGVFLLARTGTGLLRIDPFESAGQGTVYLSYFNDDRGDGGNGVDHPPDEDHHGDPSAPVPAGAARGAGAEPLLPQLLAIDGGDTLVTYRLAAATTGEYYQSRDTGNGLLDVLFSLVIEVNDVNAVFEPEIDVRLILAGGTLALIYDDPDTDPFQNDDDPNTDDNDPNTSGDVEGEPCDLREENRDNTKAVLNDADYDLGFLFTTRSGTGGSGCAWFVVCLTSDDTLHKARGAGKIGLGNMPLVGSATGLLLHEIGHQLGARHTYSGQASGCNAANFEPTAAYAPGSGSTIASYRGSCGDDNVDTSNVPSGQYFHTHSFEEIADNIQNGDGATCGNASATGNLAPVVDAGPDYTIPRGTPFTLDGSAVDADPLTYTWEQYDLAVTQRPIDTDDGIGPIIRSVPHTSDSSRTIPNLGDILSNTTRKGEILPSTDRDLTFRLTARDNRTGGGGVAYDTMVVHVDGAPFFLTHPNGGETFFAGCPVPVTWTVGGGDVAADVNILFSEDGGNSFGTTLLSGTPNDGGEVAELTCATTGQARMKAEGDGNIFFDVSDGNFTVASSPPTVSVATGGGEVDDACEFLVSFEALVTDDCGVAAADVAVNLFQQAANYTLGVPNIVIAQQDATTVTVDGSVLISDLMSSPAVLGIEVEAEDLCGADADDFAEAIVVDTTPPEISVDLDPHVLWPPNHKMWDITATVVATDNCPGVTYELTSVTSNEPDNGQADGNTVDDIQAADTGTPDLEFSLRSERAGNGSGRTYTATYTAKDGSDNEAEDSDEVNVPKSQGK